MGQEILRNPRVLVIANSATPDRTPVLDKLASSGVDVSVLYAGAPSSAHGWGHVSIGHSFETLPSGVRGFFRALQIGLSAHYDVLVSYGYRRVPFVATIFAARTRRTPIVVRSDTNVDQARSEPVVKRRLRRLIAKTILGAKATAWTVGSRNSVFWMEEIGLRREKLIPFELLTLPGGLRPRKRVRRRYDTLRIVYVGRLIPEKRVNDLLWAVLGLDEDTPWTLTIVGKGPELEALKRDAASDPRVYFAGALDHSALGALLTESDVLVLPSSSEAWGLVINEALGYGVRVLASDRVGSAWDLLDDTNGAIFPVGDVAAITSELRRSATILTQEPRVVDVDQAQIMREDLLELLKFGASGLDSKC